MTYDNLKCVFNNCAVDCSLRSSSSAVTIHLPTSFKPLIPASTMFCCPSGVFSLESLSTFSEKSPRRRRGESEASDVILLQIVCSRDYSNQQHQVCVCVLDIIKVP